MNNSVEQRIAGLARELAAALSAAGKKVSVAESCTGGWIAKSMTDFPFTSFRSKSSHFNIPEDTRF